MGLLYKYRACCKYTEQIFTTGCLHYSFRNDFNDPYDSVVCLDRAREFYFKGVALTRDKQIEEINLTFANDELEQIYQDVLGKLEILCLSKNGRQIQMWAHYANNHKGLCLEFDEEKLLSGWSMGAKIDVNYQHEPFIARLKRPDEIDFDNLLGIFRTKEKGWEYEQEVRLLRPLEEGQKKQDYPFNKKALKTIYFGSHCTSRNIKKYIRLCKKNGFEHVKFRQMVFANNGKFELEAKEI